LTSHILYDEEEGMACLYCPDSGWVYGPVFYDDLVEDGDDAQQVAGQFLEFCKPIDPRSYGLKELIRQYNQFLEVYEK